MGKFWQAQDKLFITPSKQFNTNLYDPFARDTYQNIVNSLATLVKNIRTPGQGNKSCMHIL